LELQTAYRLMKKIIFIIILISSLGSNSYAISLEDCIKIGRKVYVVNEEGLALFAATLCGLFGCLLFPKLGSPFVEKED